ncbi:MAG: hypothetical protein RL227_2143, partial [Pseudomonadota bacterium]
ASLSLALLLALSAPVATAQNAAARASQFYEDALQRFDKKDYAGAVVQLKNVLRLDGKNLSAQVLLGRALLEDGQLNAAEVAFAEAIRLGVNRAEVVVPMAEATVRQGRPDAVLSEARFAVEGLPRNLQFGLLLIRAAAAVDMADLKAALKAVEDARAIRPTDAASFEAEVPVRIRMGQTKEALAAADRAVSIAPTSASAHFTLGEAHHVLPDLAKAMAAYDKVLSIEPEHVGALVARAGVRLDLNRVADAQRDVEAALKKSPREARALYLKAQIAERQGRGADARAAYNELTAQIDPIPSQYLRYRPQTQMLGGMAHHALGQREKAKPYLEGVIRAQPGNPVAKVLADIHLADRSTDSATNVLESYLRTQPGDAQAVLLLANAHLNAGRGPRAVQILQTALAVRDDASLRAALGLALVASAQYDEALKELSAVHKRSPGHLGVGFSLGALNLQLGQAGEALRVVQPLAKLYPKDANLTLLLGQILRARADRAGAKAAFDAALALDPQLDAARIGLARVAMEESDNNTATRLLDTVLKRNDKHTEAIATVAELSERRGKLDQAERWLQRAAEISGANAPGASMALADFHLRHGHIAKAQEAVRQAQAKAPDAPLTLTMAGRVALASGDAGAARTQLARAATAAGYNVPQLTQIASLQLQAGATEAAAYSLDKALSVRAEHLPAMALRARSDIRLGAYAQAEQRIKRIQALQPRTGESWALAGELATARSQHPAALAAFKRAHELEKSTRSFMQLFASTAAKDAAGGMQLAEQWLRQNPRDAFVWRALADTQLNAGRLPAARRSYESLLALGVRDPDALNNLAQVLLQLNDGGALKVAEQALALAPTAGHVIGTAGWASFKAGQPDRALQLLRDARLRNPNNADTRYYLASVLASLGRSGEARTELTAALAPESGLSQRSEAEQLLRTLR